MRIRGLVLVSMVVAGAQAAQAGDDVLTLQEVLKRARADAPAVASSQAQTGVAQARVSAAQSAVWPTVNGSVGATASGQNTNNYGGTAACSDPALGCASRGGVFGSAWGDAQVNARWLLWDFGHTGEQVRAAELGVHAARADVDTTRNQAALNAGVAFLAVAADQDLLAARSKLVDQRAHLVDIAHGRVEAGVTSSFEETRARVSLETARLDVLNAQAAAQSDTANLARALGMPAHTALQIAAPEPLVVVDDPQQAADAAEQNRPEVQAQKHRVEAAEQVQAAARSAYLPQLSASATVGSKATAFSLTTGAVTENGSLGANLAIPIYDASLSASEQAANASTALAKAQLREQVLGLRADATDAAITVRTQRQSLQAAMELSKQADENYAQVSGRYEAGSASILDLVDAETQQAAATLTVLQARFQLESAKLRLLQATGKLGG